MYIEKKKGEFGEILDKIFNDIVLNKLFDDSFQYDFYRDDNYVTDELESLYRGFFSSSNIFKTKEDDITKYIIKIDNRF